MKIILTLLICLIFSSCHNISFDSKEWINWEENESNMRLRLDMFDDLISNYNLIGKSLAEIELLLGKTDDNYLTDNCILSYSLGPCRGLLGIDYGVLTLEIKNRKVIKIDKHCH